MEPSATPSSSDDMPCHVAAPTLESKTMRISAKEYRGKWGRSNSHSNVKAPCRASLSRAARLALAAWKASAGTSSPKFFLIFFSYSSISSLSFEPSRKSAMRFGSSLSASSSVVPTPRASRVQRAASSRSGCSRSLKSFRMPAYAKSSLSMPKSVTWHSSMSSKIILKSSGDSGGVFFFLSFSSPSLPLSFFPSSLPSPSSLSSSSWSHFIALLSCATAGAAHTTGSATAGVQRPWRCCVVDRTTHR